ncbi:PDZ domain-containing protein [Ideonella sp. A 288]|uniref:PDZ domain-containing protein n=1 Tax=Ideonella sp. A 288 TaxID=1962181 RepID=UPI001185D1EC|nr:PDZ domain-containing protein [Ideonella sp. A 288]
MGHWTLPSTPGTVSLTTSHAPLQVTCQAAPGASGRTGAPATVAPPGAAGAVAGGVAGGAAIGAAVGATALSFIPPLGVIVVLSGVAVGAATGHSVAADLQSIRYPEVIRVGLDCRPPGPAVAPPGPRVGLDVRSLTPDEARAAGLGDRRGVRVLAVVADGHAAAADLQTGDILLSADGVDLADAADLAERVLVLPPGSALVLKVWRHGQALERRLTKPGGMP